VINKQVVEMLTELAKERGLEKRVVIETLKESIIAAAKKKTNIPEGWVCEISEASGEIRLFLEKEVVKKVENPDVQISIEEAKELKPGVKSGEKIYVEIPLLETFGRNAINLVRNSLIQKMKENEKQLIYKKYVAKIGELVSGTVATAYSSGAYIKLAEIEAFLDKEDQIPGEVLRRGQTLKAVVKEVEEKPKDKTKVRLKGPVIYLTRVTETFIRKLFEFEIPEILRGEVEIKKIARRPGVRCKIAVFSSNEKIDPVGACVGPRGARIQGIVKEMSGEKIDIIAWSSDPKILVGRALSPAKVTKVVMKKSGDKAICVVPDDQVTLAIGKDSINVELAKELVGMDIEIKGQTEYHKEEEEKRRVKIKVENLDLPKRIKEILKKHGYKNAKDIMTSTAEELLKLPGIGKKAVDKIYTAVHKALNLGE